MLAFLPQRHFPDALPRAAPGQGRSPTDTKGASHSVLGPARHQEESDYFSWVYSQFPCPSPNPVEQGRGSAVHKQYGADLCFPALCVGGGCRAPLQGRWQLALPVVSRLGANGAGLCSGRAGDPTAAYHGERIFCQPLQQYHGVSSPIEDRLAPVLCTAVPMGRDVAHPLAAPTWVPPATGTLQLEQLRHCCPPACNSGPDDWQPDS